jgi:hypothetical protein
VPNQLYTLTAIGPTFNHKNKKTTDAGCVECVELTKNLLDYTCWQQLEEYNGWIPPLVIEQWSHHLESAR